MEAFFSTYTGKDESAAEQFRRISEILGGFNMRFTAPTLLNSWVNYWSGFADAGYSKDPFGGVHLRGRIKSGTATPGTTLFTLPVGFRPRKDLSFPTISNALLAYFDVKSNGDVVIRVGSTTWFTLVGYFLADG